VRQRPHGNQKPTKELRAGEGVSKKTQPTVAAAPGKLRHLPFVVWKFMSLIVLWLGLVIDSTRWGRECTKKKQKAEQVHLVFDPILQKS